MRPARASPSSPTRSRSWRRRRRRRPRTSPAGCRPSRATPPPPWPRSARSARSSRRSPTGRPPSPARWRSRPPRPTRCPGRCRRPPQGSRPDRRQHHRRLVGGGLHHPGADPDPHRGGRAVPHGRRPARRRWAASATERVHQRSCAPCRTHNCPQATGRGTGFRPAPSSSRAWPARRMASCRPREWRSTDHSAAAPPTRRHSVPKSSGMAHDVPAQRYASPRTGSPVHHLVQETRNVRSHDLPASRAEGRLVRRPVPRGQDRRRRRRCSPSSSSPRTCSPSPGSGTCARARSGSTTENLEPLNALSAVQRATAAHRARVLEYAVSDPQRRVELLGEMEEKNADIEAALAAVPALRRRRRRHRKPTRPPASSSWPPTPRSCSRPPTRGDLALYAQVTARSPARC